MTAISAIINKFGISISSDSLITTVKPNGKHQFVEWQKSKIIPIKKFRACMSYWGFAGLIKENISWEWNLYDWLKIRCLNPVESTIEEFGENLFKNLEEELNRLNIPNNLKGLGIHLVGFEYIENYWIPELFLISNFNSTKYDVVKELKFSRHTFHTLKKVPCEDEHRNSEYRLQVKTYLLNDGYFFYNNGDPEMYNIIAKSIHNGIEIANAREILKKIEDFKSLYKLARRPIEIISHIQKDFFKEDKRKIGGKIHDLSISNNGQFFSTSGDDKD